MKYNLRSGQTRLPCQARGGQVIALMIVILSWIIALWAYPALPSRIASHWNAAGEVDGYSSRVFGAFFPPGILLFCYLLFMFIPYLDPKKENIAKFIRYYDGFIVVFSLFFLYLQILMLWASVYGQFDMVRFLVPAFAGLFYYAGVLMRHAQPNWTIGIRTPPGRFRATWCGARPIYLAESCSKRQPSSGSWAFLSRGSPFFL